MQILVVEDERIIALDIARTLKELGHAVTITTASGENATRYAETLRPNLVLMDIELQGEIDGIEAAHRIWSQLHIPTLFVTAQTDEKTLHRAESATGALGVLRKPFNRDQLQSAVEKAFSGKKNTEQ